MGRHRKIAVLFDVDDTLYDQTMPFVQAYGKYLGDALPVSAEELFPVTRKYSNAVFSRALAGEITMEDLYICRLKKALEEFGVENTVIFDVGTVIGTHVGAGMVALIFLAEDRNYR